jgi:hypothetical protein
MGRGEIDFFQGASSGFKIQGAEQMGHAHDSLKYIPDLLITNQIRQN